MIIVYWSKSRYDSSIVLLFIIIVIIIIIIIIIIILIIIKIIQFSQTFCEKFKVTRY